MGGIKQREARREEITFIDTDLNYLFEVATTTGTAAIIKGGPSKSSIIGRRSRSGVTVSKGSGEEVLP